MKKLTKTLSLVLVIAMVFSLCVVGVSAKTDFADQNSINDKYVEAVDVMSGIGIIEGTGKGFEPTGTFTRAAAAKIITYMQLGAPAAEALTQKATFSDSVNHWATTYIAYCAQQGIINGYNATTFGPDDTLTGYQWTKMLLCAVGFGTNKEYVGSAWSLNAARDGMKYGVYTANVGVLVGSTGEVITREVATAMAFNTLVGLNKVTYSALLGDYIDATQAANGITTDGTLATTVYNLHSQKALADDPDYGYQGHVWYKGAAYSTKTAVSGWYMDDVIVDTNVTAAGMTGDQLYKAYSWANEVTVIVNGEADSTTYAPKTQLKGQTAKLLGLYAGAQFNFVDTDADGDVDEIVAVVPYFGKVIGVKAATSTTERQVLVTVYNRNGSLGAYNDVNVYVESADLVKGDYVSVVPAGNSALTANALVDVLAITKLTPTTTTVDEYTVPGEATYGDVTATGTTTAINNAFNAELVGNGAYVAGAKYDLYVSANGFVIGSVLNEGNVPSYAFVMQSSCATNAGSLIGDTNLVKAKVVLTDGTVTTVNYAVNTCTVTGKPDQSLTRGDKYIVFVDGSGAKNYVVLDGATSVGADMAKDYLGLNGTVVTYTVDDNGDYTFSQVTEKTIGAVTYDAAWNVTTADTLTVSTNDGSVVVDPAGETAASAVGYATAGTALVTVDAAGKATTITGYANFKNNDTFEVGNNCTAIWYVTAGKYVTNIIVVDSAEAAPAAIAGVYVGIANVSNVQGKTFYNFKCDGVNTRVALSDEDAAGLVLGNAYVINYALDGSALAPVEISDGAVEGYVNGAKGGSYIGVSADGTTVEPYYFTENTKTYAIDAEGNMTTAAAADGDAVYLQNVNTVGTKDYVGFVFVMTNAPATPAPSPAV